MNARLIQALALVVLLICTAVCGKLLPPIMAKTEEAGLRYTDISVEGAPPFVALGTAIGALRGLIVDYLWIKIHIMKEKGLFYEVMADAELITKLQPRFAAVWAFHGHNMAYNISVASLTQQERWEWVNAGIRLVRNEGLRHNPNDLVLHKELAFWFGHKIEGYSDDAHLYYKKQFCREWHFVLGEPPIDQEARIEWIKNIADAPRTLEELVRSNPDVGLLIDELNESLTPFGESQSFEPNMQFLSVYGMWSAVTQQSTAAEILGEEQRMRRGSPFFLAFDTIAADPSKREAWDALVAFVRHRVLVEDYNMDPQLMYEYTRDLGPIDWRHGQSHALYWSRRGARFGQARVASEDDVYKMINNDRLQVHAMQDLARYGRITYDPFSTELPSRFPDPRWIDTIEDMFEELYTKYYGTRGAGGESFIAFLQNFMSSAIREAYRSGERVRAQMLLDRLNDRFGAGTATNSPAYAVSLEVFVRNEIRGEYTFQPHIAPSEAVAALRYGFREGIGRDREEIYDQSLAFVNEVIEYFQGNDYNDYVTRYGEGRMKDLLADLRRTKPVAYVQLMTDPTIGMEEKMIIWANTDKHDPRLRLETYDAMAPALRQQFARHERSRAGAFDVFFPEPPGLEQYQFEMEKRRRDREQRERDTLEQK